MNDLSVVIKLSQLNDLLSVAERVPALEKQFEELQRSYAGLRLLYSEILETLRSR